MDNVKFNFYIGDTYTRDFIITGYSSDIDDIFFTVKKNVDDKNYVLQKTLNNGITLVDVTYDTDGTTILSRTYNLLINAEDTETFTPESEYVFDIEIVTDETPDLKKTIMTGTIELTNSATRNYNE